MKTLATSVKHPSANNIENNLSQYVVGNSKFFFRWKCMKCMLEYMIRQYQSFLSKLVYKVEVDRLKELSKISRYSGSHFVSFLENFQTIPGNSQQNTHRSAGGCQVLLKALGWNEKESLAKVLIILMKCFHF